MQTENATSTNAELEFSRNGDKCVCVQIVHTLANPNTLQCEIK